MTDSETDDKKPAAMKKKTPSQHKRMVRHDKKMSMKKKKLKREEKKWFSEDQILLTHIPYNCDSTKSPHILINKWYHRLSDNCIVLSKPREIGSSTNRQIYYDIDVIGKNIKYVKKKNYLNLHIDNMKQKWVMILVKFKDIMYNNRLCFFSEIGVLLDEKNLALNKEGYVVLATIQHDSRLLQGHLPFSAEELNLAKNFLYNQVSSSNKEYHFRTSGTIHSFGYGAKYTQHPTTKYSVDKFATSKLSSVFLFH